MKLYFLKDINQHSAGDVAYVELSIGRRFVDKGVAIPYVTHLENVERAAQEKAEARKEALLKKQEEKQVEEPEKATSKKAAFRRKAVKKS